MGSWVLGRNLTARAVFFGFYLNRSGSLLLGIFTLWVRYLTMVGSILQLLVAFFVTIGSALPSQPMDEMRIATYFVDNVDFTGGERGAATGDETLEVDENEEGWVNGHPQWGNIDENDVEQILQLPEG